MDRFTALKIVALGFLWVFTVQCSHKYNSNDLDLSYYQWNMWAEEDGSGKALSTESQAPSCGWEEFNRGVGKLVRIPASFDSQFTDQENQGVLWYHCRFTLPELWEARTIKLYIEKAGPRVDLFLNEQLVDSNLVGMGPIEVDLSAQVYYVRDNHLAIKVTTSSPESDPGSFGVLGKVIVKSGVSENESANELRSRIPRSSTSGLASTDEIVY